MSETIKIKVNDISLAYTVEGNGRPLIMAHGNGEDKSIFDELAASLLDRFTVYRIDSRCHGESDAAKLSYDLMAEDVAAFIRVLGITNAEFLGFSDGGIVGLLLAIKYPNIIDKYYILGANANPKGLSKKLLRLYRTAYFFFRDPKIGLMLKEPNITVDELKSIESKCVIIAGEKDVVLPEHTKMLSRLIPDSELIIMEGYTHTDYIVHSDKLKSVIE